MVGVSVELAGDFGEDWGCDVCEVIFWVGCAVDDEVVCV